MNGGHDLGGMHGLGPIDAEPDEPVFHADWERRVFALVRATGALGIWNADMARHARERQHPADYLGHSYYENWLAGFVLLLRETGIASEAELETGRAETPGDPALVARRVTAAEASLVLTRGAPADRPALTPPRFHSADRVRAVNRHPTGHTREPRYVRGRVGVIHSYHGAHVYPDRSAAGIREGHHLYTVRFEAAELWGAEANGRSAVYVDLWEDYLEPA